MELRIYYAKTTALRDPEVFSAIFQALPSERQERIERVRPPESKRQLAACGKLLQEMCLDAGIPDADRELGYNAYGKPYFLKNSEFHFNLSHSGEYVLGALSSQELGCDIQSVTAMNDRLLQRIGNDAERSFIEALTAADRSHAMTKLWCRKEAVLKALGTGLAVSPLSIDCPLSEDIAYCKESDCVFSLMEPAIAAGFCACVAFPASIVPQIRILPIHLTK